MITLPGTLFVKTIHGRRGDFAVGNLITEIGEFKVKDTLLDQFSEGEYRGRFALARIFQGAYSWKGATISELRASISDIELFEATEKPVVAPEAPTVSDPLEDPVQAPEAPPAPSHSAEAAPAVPAPVLSAPDREAGSDVARALAAGLPVKLDPTVDRVLFRTQRDQLKAAGYRFDAATQSWLPPAAAA